MLRFGPLLRRNPVGDLVNLNQLGTIEQYQKFFQEKLARASHLVRPELYASLFTAGLVESLRLEVELEAPTSLAHAMNLARALDTKQSLFRDSLTKRPPWQPRPQPTGPFSTTPQPQPHTPSRTPPPAFTTPPGFIKCLTKAEIDQRRAQGLCFNCDEKFIRGHQCNRLFLVEIEDTTEDDFPEDVDQTEEEPEISLHAMIGQYSANTMQVHATMNHLILLALVDSGSTHNFISSQAAQQLGLSLQQKSGISVSVANGDKVTTVSFYLVVSFTIDGHPFVVEFLVIPLVGFDLVLGIKWLQ
ncbi:uncharacterized protein [Aristolochia californica]|uniref:uncharacterized protein n=1 Tax=Aristolochia californica TaxID=171875 RepID=UPI0035D8D9FD